MSDAPKLIGREPTPTIEQARNMGAKGAPATEAERLLFEAWMAGHCWALCAEWDGESYRGSAEHGEYLDPRAMNTRQLWAAWRDRAALLAASPQPAQDHIAEVGEVVGALRWTAAALQAQQRDQDVVTIDGERKAVGQILDDANAALAKPAEAEQQAPATEQAPPLPEVGKGGCIVDIDGNSTQHYTADQLRERDAMWMAKISALQSEQAPAGEVPGGLMQAIRGEVPLKEPVNISKALPAGRKAEVWLNNGTGPVACVGLVNIQLAGWRHTKETAEAFAEGYNRALADLRASILDVALSTPPAVPQIPEGWMRDIDQVTMLAEHLENMGYVQTASGDVDCADQGSAMAAEVVRKVLLPALSAAPAAPQGEQT